MNGRVSPLDPLLQAEERAGERVDAPARGVVDDHRELREPREGRHQLRGAAHVREEPQRQHDVERALGQSRREQVGGEEAGAAGPRPRAHARLAGRGAAEDAHGVARVDERSRDLPVTAADVEHARSRPRAHELEHRIGLALQEEAADAAGEAAGVGVRGGDDVGVFARGRHGRAQPAAAFASRIGFGVM